MGACNNFCGTSMFAGQWERGKKERGERKNKLVVLVQEILYGLAVVQETLYWFEK